MTEVAEEPPTAEATKPRALETAGKFYTEAKSLAMSKEGRMLAHAADRGLRKVSPAAHGKLSMIYKGAKKYVAPVGAGLASAGLTAASIGAIYGSEGSASIAAVPTAIAGTRGVVESVGKISKLAKGDIKKLKKLKEKKAKKGNKRERAQANTNSVMNRAEDVPGAKRQKIPPEALERMTRTV